MSPLRALLKGVLLVRNQASPRQWMIFWIVIGISLLIFVLHQAGAWPRGLHLPIGLLVRLFIPH